MFDGTYQNWVPFRDLFTSVVHESSAISNVQKLHHLKTHLTGEAERLIRHINVTETNYDIAWETLKNRYENKRVLVNTYLHSLFSQPSLNQESSQGLRRLLDQTNQSLKALENLGINVANWDVLIIYIKVQKLPPETHKAWEQKLGSRTDLPSLKDLRDCLEIRFRTLEAVDYSKQKLSREIPCSSSNRLSVTRTQSFHSTQSRLCPLCHNHHPVRQCNKFLKLDINQRNKIVRERGLCLNCLGQGHLLLKCPSQRSCSICGKKHHTSLHRENPEANKGQTMPNTTKKTEYTDSQNSVIQSMSSNQDEIKTYFTKNKPSNDAVLLATALVLIISPSGERLKLRALIDQGSEASFITEYAVQHLKLKKERIFASVSGIGHMTTNQVQTRTSFEIISTVGNAKTNVNAFILKSLTTLLPHTKLMNESWNHVMNLELADPSYDQPGRIDLLLGAEVYAQILLEGLRKGPEGTPIAQQTSLGWILFGRINTQRKRKIEVTSLHLQLDLNMQLKKFWEIEELNAPKQLTKEERMCEDIYNTTHKRNPNGSYTVQLPFKSSKGNLNLGRSRDIAVARLKQMENRLEKHPALRQEYTNCIQEYLALGHMSKVTKSEDEHANTNSNGRVSYSCSYLPHHAIIKESSSTTKLRIVFDASRATSNGTSLNDVLLTGPTIQEDIISILLRWRKHKIAFTADINKMYRQVRVFDKDAEYQRILWRNSKNDQIEDYRLETVTFGTASAPFLAIRTLRQLALDEKNFPVGSETVLNDFYVDDLMSGDDDIEAATKRQDEVIKLLRKGGFQIRKWVSNSMQILIRVPEDHREIAKSHHIQIDDCTKALGIHWLPASDKLCYKLSDAFSSDSTTKREMLSNIAKLFDPLGWLSPTIIKAKILMQRVWLAGIDWDAQLPEEIQQDWNDFKLKLAEINNIRILRWVGTTTKGDSTYQLHGFSDASEQAYAACVYIRVEREDYEIETNLLIAKTRVAPIKKMTLPRLELCGAALAAKLLKKCKEALKIENIQIFAWSDSAIVLAWLQGHPNNWK